MKYRFKCNQDAAILEIPEETAEWLKEHDVRIQLEQFPTIEEWKLIKTFTSDRSLT